ncbi:MAG TPA: hypothetical protein VGF45_21680 [Polyangia bacterium]
MFRFLLVLVLVHGLVPGLGELVETVAHRVTEGHFAHDLEQGHDRGESTDEHGCGTTSHLCRCCPNQPVLTVLKTVSLDLGQAALGLYPPVDSPVTESHVRNPFRPPIG